MAFNSKAILDYALFQLTPTRTRCELLVFCGGSHQKIASGLFEPFVSHLKFLRDEISKGGYSIKLLPPSNSAFWFTRATFERFVRFVSTPAILERFVSLENEILQIESSFQANALSMSNATPDEGIVPQNNGNTRRLSDSAKLNDVLEGVDVKEEESSKVSLHRLLESRIALLRKEQAMAYSRGLVAGFEIDSIDDLIYFANAFGAIRLREACINFKELWKKKHADDLWIKEVAAMQSSLPPALSLSGSSGIVLTNDITANDQNSIASGDGTETSNSSLNKKEDVNLPTPDQKPSHTANVHMPMPWPYNVPPYMYNLPQIPSYQGYPMTNMQTVPPYLLPNVQWSPDQGVNQKQSSTKKDKSHKKRAEEYEEDEQSESSDPNSGSESDSDKQNHSSHSSKDDLKRRKHRRKSSGTVVIRNINYITPKRRNGNEDGASDESLEDDDIIDEQIIKQKVGVALESLQKVHKGEKHANGKNAAARHKVTKTSDATEEDLAENLSDASQGGNNNDNWSAFQNLLKIDEGTGIDGPERMESIDVRDEHFMVRSSEETVPYAAGSTPNLDFKEVLKNPKVPNDSFIVAQRDRGNEGGSKLDEYVDNCGPVTKSKDNVGEEIVLSHRSKEPGNKHSDPLSTFAADSLQTKGRTSDDWFIVENLEKMRSPHPEIVSAVFDGDYTSPVNGHAQSEKRSERTFVDDSFMIQGQLVNNDLSGSQWKTDLSMVADLTLANKAESDAASSNEKRALSKSQEPNDLFVVLRRDSGLDSTEGSRTMDYEIDFSLPETDRRFSFDHSHDKLNENLPASPEKTSVTKSKTSGTRSSEKDEKSKALRSSAGKGKPEIISRARKPSLPSRPIVQKSKREQEDENRKRMEELRNERQRRIAERTASSGLARGGPKKDQIEGKTARVSPKNDKNKTQPVKETNRNSSVKVRGF
ncbi:COP1-interacting protein 7 [Vigna umbellata]|uniref:COP1-interacting protein 7 n=1 Tax=Vigna umbellata TaxID=87088 RepID=UPI001F5F3857|nr:COP1-interacting protein 7 [Vigna umbellata]